MSKVMGVAEVKRKFSEVVGDVVFKKETYIIERRGKPVVAIVGLEDEKKLKKGNKKGPKKGLLAALAAWEDFEGLDQMVKEIYHDRQKAKDEREGGL